MAAKSKAKRAAGKSSAGLADYPMANTVSGVDKKAQRRYAAEDALHVLTRAEEHRSNPSLMRDVKRLAAERAQKMARIAKR